MSIPEPQAPTRVNWKYVILFYALAFLLSAPFNSGYLDEWYQNLTAGTILYKSEFLFAGFGTLIAGLLAFRFDKTFARTVTTFWGNSKPKNLVLTLVPLLVFTIVGIPNGLGQEEHLYAFQISLLLTVYALAEEVFWRGYLINALSPLGKWKNYLLLGLFWWAWHFPFMREGGYTLFLLMVLVSSLLIGKFVEGTKSYLTAAGLHALIVIAQHGDNAQPLLYAGGVVILIWMLLGSIWKSDLPKRAA